MPGTSIAKRTNPRRRAASAGLLTLAFAGWLAPDAASAGPIGEQVRQWSAHVKARGQLGSDAPRPEGPIAAGFKQWSSRRQAKARVEKPFANHTGSVDLSQSSSLQRLRSKLTGKSGDVASSHVVKVEYMKHERGVLQH